MAKEQTSYQKWYAKNKAKVNDARRTRYQTDPEYRTAAILASREARANRPVASVESEHRWKRVGGVLVETMSISELAQSCGKSIQTIRIWEAKGLIPEPTVDAGKRFYTKLQGDLVKELSGVMDASRRLTRIGREFALDQIGKKIAALWAVL